MVRKKLLMNEKHILRLIMISAGETIKSVADKVGIKGTALSNQLSRPESTMTLTSVYTLLDAMGYEIVVRKKKVSKDSAEYVLTEIDSVDDAAWRKKIAIAKADEEVRRIESERYIPAGEIDRIKSDTSNKAEPRKPVQPLPTRKRK